MPRVKNPTPNTEIVDRGEMEVEDLSLQYGSPFLIASHKEGIRFQGLIINDITSSRYIDWNLMRLLEIEAKVSKYLKALQLFQFANMKYPAYNRLILEFLVSFEYDERAKLQIAFRMKRDRYEVDLKLMKEFFGFSTSGIKERPSTFSVEDAWFQLSGFRNWNPKGTPSKFIQDPALSILHKFIAYNISGKEQANKVNSTEVFLLWCAKKKKKICPSTFIWASIHSTLQRETQHPSFCAFISALAIKLGVINDAEPVPDGQIVVPPYRIDKNELKRAQIIVDERHLMPQAKRSCVEKLRLVQEATMRPNLGGASSSNPNAEIEEEGQEQGAEGAESSEEEVPINQQSNTGWESFRGYYDTSMGQFQQNIHQTFTDSMGGFQQTIMDSMGQFQQNFASSMDQYRQEFTHRQGQFQNHFDTSMGEFRRDIGDLRQEMGSLRHDFGEYQQGVNSRLDSHGDRMTALEQSWNAWTLSYPHIPPPTIPAPPPPPFDDTQQ